MVVCELGLIMDLCGQKSEAHSDVWVSIVKLKKKKSRCLCRFPHKAFFFLLFFSFFPHFAENFWKGIIWWMWEISGLTVAWSIVRYVGPLCLALSSFVIWSSWLSQFASFRIASTSEINFTTYEADETITGSWWQSWNLSAMNFLFCVWDLGTVGIE